MNSHYDVLVLSTDASLSEIKAAYHQAVLKYHPDKSSEPTTQQMFDAVQTAWQVRSPCQSDIIAALTSDVSVAVL
jgi:curved DNA-binding protein CbpA